MSKLVVLVRVAFRADDVDLLIALGVRGRRVKLLYM